MSDLFRSIREFFSMLPSIGIMDILDIALVAFVIYEAINLLRSTNAMRMLRVIFALAVFSWLTSVMELRTMSWLLGKFWELGFIALLIVFQPELRRLMERLGGKSVKGLLDPRSVRTSEMESAITETVEACRIMSQEKIGVLIVFERTTLASEYTKTGTEVDAMVSASLLRNIFFPKAALHDGAVIIRAGRVFAAGCVLPLTENRNLNADLGTRHRAAIGMSEVSDAVVVVVSEETGTLSVAQDGMLKRHLAPQTLEKLLRSQLLPSEEGKANIFQRTKSRLNRKEP